MQIYFKNLYQISFDSLNIKIFKNCDDHGFQLMLLRQVDIVSQRSKINFNGSKTNVQKLGKDKRITVRPLYCIPGNFLINLHPRFICNFRRIEVCLHNRLGLRKLFCSVKLTRYGFTDKLWFVCWFFFGLVDINLTYIFVISPYFPHQIVKLSFFKFSFL